jgi:hypothetical protein
MTEHSIISAVVDENGRIVISDDSLRLGLQPGQKIKLLVVFSPGNYGGEGKEELTEGARLLAELQAEDLIGFAGPRSDDFAPRLREVSWKGGENLQGLIKEQE